VTQLVCRISALLLFGLSTIPVRAANPDLSLAPLPNLSQSAWGELQANHAGVKVVTLKATITARGGTITDVTVKETARWPQTSAEVQAWIKQHWKFVPAFSGTVVQPVSFKILQGHPTASKRDPWINTAWDLLLRSPKPDFPMRYRAQVAGYAQGSNDRRAGVYLSITARNAQSLIFGSWIKPARLKSPPIPSIGYETIGNLSRTPMVDSGSRYIIFGSSA